MNMRRKVSWSGEAVSTKSDQRHIRTVKMTRTVSQTPVTKSGAELWAKREVISEDSFTVDVEEIPDMLQELVSWVTYFASGRAEEDRP
jgi:hypothetical protein